jgi:hypothetical protein
VGISPETGISRNEELSSSFLVTLHNERWSDSVNVSHPSVEDPFTEHIHVNVVRNVSKSVVNPSPVVSP